MNTYLIIFDKNKGFKLKKFSEECVRLCSSENDQTDVKGGLRHKKVQEISKMNRRHYNL